MVNIQDTNSPKKLTYEEKQIKLVKNIFVYSIVGVFLLIILFGSWYTIPTGQRGIITTFGKPTMESQGEGLHFKIPFVQAIHKMNVQTQLYSVDKASAASKDLQTATTSIAINYYINPEQAPEIYRNIGMNYQGIVIAPAVLEVMKASTAQYTAEELVTKRPEAKDKIDLGLRERLKEFGINVQAVSITDFKFSDQFELAIEGKVTAEQNALAEKNNLAKVEYQAQQRIAQAKGEAEAIQIQAQAIQSQGGASYVELQRIAKWDGHYPLFMGSGTSAILDMRSVSAFTTTNYTQ